ncbi:hypothetical protein ACFW04_013121 [Cataglyphis niger]
MICVETQHFPLNRILLLAIGLWPYQRSKLNQLQATLCFGILSSFVVFQLTALITTKCTVDFIIKVFSTAIVFNFYIIMYNMFWINIDHVRNLLDQLQCICNELKDENEFAIFKKYGNNTKRCTLILTLLSICCIFFVILLSIWPHVFSTLLHITNESQIQSQTIQIVTEYFIDQEKYYYLILLHTCAVFCIGATTVTAIGAMLLGCLIHAYGLFTIASYRIEQAMTTKIFENINLDSRSMICKKICYAVEIHHETMKFINFILSSFEGSFFMLIMLSVISLSLNFFAIFHNASLGKEAFILHILYVLVIYLSLFAANYAGQEVLNYSTHIYSTTYNVQWYNAPLHVQKMILLILQRGSKTFSLNIAGLFKISLECFAMVKIICHKLQFLKLI